VQFLLHQGNRIAILDVRKEEIKTEATKPLLDAFQLVGIS
jgi:hypothetical protein